MNSLILLGCGNKNKDKESEIELKNSKVETKSLLDNVRLAINPKFKDWVLFENGTYIIFDDITQIEDTETEAIRLMKEFGPVHAGGPAGDFNVISLNETEGWVVSGHGYGMYTSTLLNWKQIRLMISQLEFMDVQSAIMMEKTRK